MLQLFDKTTKRFKKKAGKTMDLLRPPSRQSIPASPARLRQVETPTGLAAETGSLSPEPTATAAVTKLAPASISVATDLSQHAQSAATESALPPADEVSPTIPAYAEGPSPPTAMETAGSALKGLLVAARDGSDLFLPLKAALVGVVALWDIFDASPLTLL